jgi:cytochrome P450
VSVLECPAVPVLRLRAQLDGGPHPELRADGKARRVRAETGGDPLGVLRTWKAFYDCVTDPRWVQAGITADGEFRGAPVTGAEMQSRLGGMLNMDPPAHTVFRKPVSHIFTRAAADAARAGAEALARELAEGLRGRRAADLAADYVDPFAATMVCRSLGTNDWRNVLAGSENAFSPVHGRAAIPGVIDGWKHTYEFYARIVTHDLAWPGGTIAQIQRAFRGFSLAELAAVLGNVGNGYPAIMQSERRLMRELAGPYRAAVTACLRGQMTWPGLVGTVLNTEALYPIDLPRRLAAPDGAWLDGQFYEPGSHVLPSLVAAAASADRLAVSPVADVAFSFGRHRCPGAWLGRMLAETVARAFWMVHPHAELAGDAEVWLGDSLAAPREITVTGLS